MWYGSIEQAKSVYAVSKHFTKDGIRGRANRLSSSAVAEQSPTGAAGSVGSSGISVSELRIAAPAPHEKENLSKRLDRLLCAALSMPAVLLDRLVDEGRVRGVSDVSRYRKLAAEGRAVHQRRALQTTSCKKLG